MKHFIIYILLLAILNTILFFEQDLGINVVLFVIPLMIFISLYLKYNNLVQNKKGFLLFIPIGILSCHYLFFDDTFHFLNILVSIVLWILLFIEVVNPQDKIESLFLSFLHIVSKPFTFIDSFFEDCKASWNHRIKKVNSDTKKEIKSWLIVLPIVFIVIVLLSSADKIFYNLFESILRPLKSLHFSNLLGRGFQAFIFFTYTGAMLTYLSKEYLKEKTLTKKISIENHTIKRLLTLLNLIYFVFDIIQIRSLYFHHMIKNINYAEYAREGFFQLMVISLINLIILLISKKGKETKYNKGMSLLMIFFTMIIIASSFYRMHLYEQAYGYTVLRLGVYMTLLTVTILLIPTVCYIWNSKVPILKYYEVIIISVYTIMNFFSFDKIITKNNIQHYNKVGKIDIEYLENGNYDNISQLISFYHTWEENEQKEELRSYLWRMKEKEEYTSPFEYNISKDIAKQELNSLFDKDKLEE